MENTFQEFCSPTLSWKNDRFRQHVNMAQM